jgi:hypothetical protein
MFKIVRVLARLAALFTLTACHITHLLILWVDKLVPHLIFLHDLIVVLEQPFIAIPLGIVVTVETIKQMVELLREIARCVAECVGKHRKGGH